MDFSFFIRGLTGRFSLSWLLSRFLTVAARFEIGCLESRGCNCRTMGVRGETEARAAMPERCTGNLVVNVVDNGGDNCTHYLDRNHVGNSNCSYNLVRGY